MTSPPRPGHLPGIGHPPDHAGCNRPYFRRLLPRSAAVFFVINVREGSATGAPRGCQAQAEFTAWSIASQIASNASMIDAWRFL